MRAKDVVIKIGARLMRIMIAAQLMDARETTTHTLLFKN